MTVHYLISSHVNYKEPLNKLLNSMNYIDYKRIHVVVGGCQKERHIEASYKEVTHNSYDYTSLIDFVEAEHTFIEWVFLLHDTMEFTENTDNLISHATLSPFDCIAVANGMTNLMLIRTSYILENRDYILSLKNCSKEKAIQEEGMLWKRCKNSGHFPPLGVHNLGLKQPYKIGIERLMEYYPSIELYKYKANWGDPKRGLINKP